ncbi:hypothetical protein BGZ54_004833, partial [Gamsiella multidivaricata]
TLSQSQSPHARGLSSPGIEYAKNPHSLTPPLHPQQQHQLGQKMYTSPTGAANFGVGKVARIRNRTISSPAGSFQYSPSSMTGSTPTGVNMSRPPSGLSFGPMPVRERKRSLLDANMAQGLDQVRQNNGQGCHSASSSSSEGVNSCGTGNSIGSNGVGGNGNGEGKVGLFSVKQEPSDPNLVGLGLGGSSPGDASPEETYHRKRTKSVDMYSSIMGSLHSFTPPPPHPAPAPAPAAPSQTGAAVGPTSMDMTSSMSVASSQPTSVQNWQPPDMAIHLQMYQSSMHLNGLGSALPPNSIPMHMQMNGPIHPHQLSPGIMGSDSNLYHLQSMPMADHGQVLRHSTSHDRMGVSY